ncbi:MAG TPA: tyrosine-type recombinase/integrase [Caldilineaceae bacterium]|nr:tyrosine-type recombinase/integrase [Caldilineaceae bacterium]
MRFSEALEGFWLAKRRNYSEHTIRDYSNTFQRFCRFVGDADVGGLVADDIRRFLNAMHERYELSDKTLCNYWVALSAFWTWAEPELGIEHIIRNRVERPEYQRRRIEPYRQEEVEALLAATGKAAAWRTRTGKTARGKRPTADRDRALIVLLVDTGLRASELCDLRMEDYDRERGSLYVERGKGDKERMVYVGDSGKRALWRYLLSRKDAKPKDHLFVSASNRRLDRNNLRQTLQRIGGRAGVRGVTVHRFRHTYAITFLRNGGSPLVLQELLGHEKLDTVRIYTALAAVDLEKAQRASSPADGWDL